MSILAMTSLQLCSITQALSYRLVFFVCVITRIYVCLLINLEERSNSMIGTKDESKSHIWDLCSHKATFKIFHHNANLFNKFTDTHGNIFKFCPWYSGVMQISSRIFRHLVQLVFIKLF